MGLENPTPAEDIRQRVFQASRDHIRVGATITGQDDVLIRPGPFRTAFAVDSVSSRDMNVDGSITPVVFEIKPSSGKKYVITSLVFTIVDKSIRFLKFGGLPTLANGFKFEVKEGGLPVGEIPQSPIKDNLTFYEGGLRTFIQSEETDVLTAIFNAKEQASTALILIDADSDFIRVTIQDDLTGLDSFKLVSHGYEVDE